MGSYSIESLAAVDALADLGEVADDVVDVLDGWAGKPMDENGVTALKRGAELLRQLGDLREGRLAATDAFVQVDSLVNAGSFAAKDSIQLRVAIAAFPGSHKSLNDLATYAEELAEGRGSERAVPALLSIFDQLAEVTVMVGRSAGRAMTERESWTTETPS